MNFNVQSLRCNGLKNSINHTFFLKIKQCYYFENYKERLTLLKNKEHIMAKDIYHEHVKTALITHG